MKKLNRIYHKAALMLLSVFVLAGCSSDIDTDFHPGGLSVGFALENYSFPTFFEGVESAPLSLQFLTNKEPNGPVTLNYTISSPTGAQAGVQYNDPGNGSITINPGEGRFFDLNIDLLASGYTGDNDGRTDEFEVTFTSTDGYVVGEIGNTSTVASVFAQCVFDVESFAGTAKLHDFGDAVGDTYAGISEYDVTVSVEGENSLRITGFQPQENGQVTDYTWTLNVNTQTGVVTVPYQVYTTDDLFGFGYTDWAVQGSGNFDICNRKLNLSLTNTVDAGSFGVFTYTITW